MWEHKGWGGATGGRGGVCWVGMGKKSERFVFLPPAPSPPPPPLFTPLFYLLYHTAVMPHPQPGDVCAEHAGRLGLGALDGGDTCVGWQMRERDEYGVVALHAYHQRPGQ